MKIRSKIILGFILITSLGFVLLVNWLLRDLREHYLKSMEEVLVDSSTMLASFIADRDMDVNEDLKSIIDDAFKQRFSAEIYDFTKERINARVYITDKHGIVLYDSDNGKAEGKDYSKWNDVYLTLKGKYGTRATRSDPDTPETSVHYVAAPILVNNEIEGVLTIGKAASAYNVFLGFAKKNIIIGAMLASGAAGILGILFTLWITKPLHKLTAYALSVRDGKRLPVPLPGTDEIGQMAMAFEAMRDALEGKKYVEQFVQSLTHEIKSPLSAIRGSAELLQENMSAKDREKFTSNILNETFRIQTIVDKLLDLAALESRKQLEKVEIFDVADIVQDIISNIGHLFESKRVSISVLIPENLAVQGDPFLVKTAIYNLLHNALTFSPESSSITIKAKIIDKSMSMILEDSGPGIPDYALSKIFDRFYSIQPEGKRAKSSGLGLSFVKEITKLHGGSITLENIKSVGCRAILVLPLKQ